MTLRERIRHAIVICPSGSGFMVSVDCPFCGKEHWHGNVRDGDHRIAHCAGSDVPDNDGYVIRIPTVGEGIWPGYATSSGGSTSGPSGSGNTSAG